MSDLKTPTPQEILDLPMQPNPSGADTVRGYLVALLAEVWNRGSDFSGKRPFGMSSWETDLLVPLVKAGYIEGRFDEEGCLDFWDDATGQVLIDSAIQALGAVR